MSPGSWFRGQPFWAWNGALSPDELRRQIRIMKRMGLGGFFMHSRVGLATPYLGEEWFRCVDACVDEARKLGMLAWLYDEDRWPSGAAGGIVTRDPRYRKRGLVMSELRTPSELRWTKDTLAAFTARVKGTEASKVRQVPRGKRPSSLAPGERILVFRVKIESPSSWYNGATYLDTLNPRAVRRFIAVTHQAYRERLGNAFGNTVPGIFTDEPNHGQKFGRDFNTGEDIGLPWTDGLPAAFRRRFGYDLLPRLVELFLDVDGRRITPARHDFHDCLTELFVDSFARQIGRWCRENGILHTGHVLAEDRMSSQSNVVGSAMRFYEHMQAPGMDLLTERCRAFTTAKQVSSVARQMGRKWRLTETYGCTGWDFPFAGHKALGDWQVALGITLRCQHLAWYTMEGEAKRDYPASIFSQSPWWELYPEVEDYFARILSVMSRGEEARDLLVIHPVESMWTMIRRDWSEDPRVREYDRVLVDMEDTLLCAHLDFDYGDEEMLSRLGGVTRGGSGKSGHSRAPLLSVGRARYTAVIVPPMKTMRSTTLRLLDEFRTVGGMVVFAGEPADHIDSEPSELARALAATCASAPAAGPELAHAVDSATRRVSITDAEGHEIPAALYLLREDRDARYLFVCNTGFSQEHRARDIFDSPRVAERTLAYPEVKILLPAERDGQPLKVHPLDRRPLDGQPPDGRPLELDPRTGEMFEAEAVRTPAGGWEISTQLHALGSRLFILPRGASGGLSGRRSSPRPTRRHGLRPEQRPARRPAYIEVRKTVLEDARWNIVRTEDNVLVLDRPGYRIGKGAWRGPEEMLRVDREVRSALGAAPRGGAMVQPWARKPPKSRKKVRIELRYSFEAEALPSGSLFLALENPRLFTISFNGAGVGSDVSTDSDRGFWVDPSLRMLPLDSSLVRRGKNEITLCCDYDEEHPGLEMVYLLGDFGVEVGGTTVRMTDIPRTLALGDWVPQGLPFYSGSVSYCRSLAVERAPGEKVFLHVPDYRGTAVRVLVNGRSAGVICWEPNEVDLTDFVDEGGSTLDLRIQVIGHRRNSHGPLHHAEKWPRWTGPSEFVSTGADWRDDYQLVPCGLMKPPVLVARKPAPTG